MSDVTIKGKIDGDYHLSTAIIQDSNVTTVFE